MERLTEEKQIGPFAALKDKAEAVPGAFATYDCLYAHMGLGPEEVVEYKHLCDSYVEAGLDAKFVQFCIDATQNGLSMDCIRELTQAEKDGRLVVLPCKKGDTLWSYYDYPTRGISKIVVTAVSTLDGITNINTDNYGVLSEKDIGKTVFLTREEAEAALEEMEAAHAR